MYGLDLRTRVVNFVHSGGSKAEAARRYEVSEATVYSWLKRPDLKPTIVKRRHRKLDWQAVAEHVRRYPDERLRDRAKHFGVTISSMHYALKQMKITRKKTAKISRA
jgi:transposase